MSQQKYRYYFQHEETGHITFKEYELEEIESYDGIQIPHRYFITARCQFTGLLSKDGVEVYEGDLIKTKNSLYKVFYDKCCFWGIDVMGKYPIYQIKHYALEDEIFKVIGNIYENPELLKDTEC